MKEHKFFYLLILFISEYYAQESRTILSTDWNGDSKICTVDPSGSPSDDTPLPQFPNQAEFVIEKFKINHKSNIIPFTELTMTHYLYNYDKNRLVLINNVNGNIDVDHYYYETLKKSIYYHRNICSVSNIVTEIETDGTSAVRLQNNTWHIRPLNQFLLFSNNDTRETKIRPKFIGTAIIRGIPVDQWESCIINKTELRTIRIVWSLAQKGISMPSGLVSDSPVPIHALINTSVLYSNNTEAEKYDEIYNVHSYRPKLVKTDHYFAPPKGVFCNGQNENLMTLQDFSIQWPDYFSVRVEASTSRYAEWQRFHLRYHRDRQLGIRRLRYDYLPPGAVDYISIFHDYGDNLTYVIDRHIGICRISRGVEYPDVNPVRDPIGFFIKHENQFIFNSRDRVWDLNGNQLCRADSIQCLSVISSINNYPVIVEPDTGAPSGETWKKTNIEYGWSNRAPNAQLPPETDIYYDYPVYLLLKLYQYNDADLLSLTNVYTEDIEYEFYEMSYERNPSDFDTSLCYRSLGFDYLHLGFMLKLSQGNAIDGNHLNRRSLERIIHSNLVEKMQIKYLRISDIEVDHEDVNSDVTVFFTLLGPTPRPEPPTEGITDDEPSVNQSYANLRRSIDDGTFEFIIQLTDDPTSNVYFRAVSGSLQSSKQFMSLHKYGKQAIHGTYSSISEAAGIIGGLFIGILFGILLAGIIRVVRKKPMPFGPNSFSNPLPTITFYNKKSTSNTTTTAAAASSDA